MEIVERQEIIDLHEGLEDLTLLHITDLHLWYSTRLLTKIESLIISNPPDLILMTGDYYDIPSGAHHFRDFLCNISKTYTVLFIMGNHDKMYGTKISNLLLGIPNCFHLENFVHRFISRKGFIYNVTSWANRNNLSSNKSERNIILLHNPEKINENELLNIDLLIAGHLHGGQFILFRTKKNSNFPGCLIYKYCTDRKQIGNAILIVGKGLGDTFPFRWNCPREVVRIKVI